MKNPLSADQLDARIRPRNDLEFLNPKNELHRKLRMKEKLPSRAEALKLSAKESNLIRPPILIRGGQRVLGSDEGAIVKLGR